MAKLGGMAAASTAESRFVGAGGGAGVHSSSSSRPLCARGAPGARRARARARGARMVRARGGARRLRNGSLEGRSSCARARARARRPPRGGGARREGAGFFGDERGAVVVGGVAEQGSAGQG